MRYRPPDRDCAAGAVLAIVPVALLPAPEALRVQEAARQGGPATRDVLGPGVAQGIRVRQNPVRATLWLRVAAADGHEHTAVLRDTLAEQSTLRDLVQSSGVAQVAMETGGRRCGRSADEPGTPGGQVGHKERSLKGPVLH